MLLKPEILSESLTIQKTSDYIILREIVWLTIQLKN